MYSYTLNSLLSICHPLSNVCPGGMILWPKGTLRALDVLPIARILEHVGMSNALPTHGMVVPGTPELGTIELGPDPFGTEFGVFHPAEEQGFLTMSRDISPKIVGIPLNGGPVVPVGTLLGYMM